MLESLLLRLGDIEPIEIFGKLHSVRGEVVEAIGISKYVDIGTVCMLHIDDKNKILCEVIGFQEDIVLLMPFTDTTGVSPSTTVQVLKSYNHIMPDMSWQGRILDAFANDIDGKGALRKGDEKYYLYNTPLPLHKRGKIGGKIDLGVKSIDNFVTCCYGQRMGIFAGSGVGKSVLISMLTKYADADVKIIGLIGERSREVKEFIDEYLTKEGLEKAVVIVSTGNEPALMRLRATYLTMTIAEYFRDQGKEVLCIVDSITRFAMAQREIGLASGEPPTSKGYTPSVFAKIPQLLERAGPGEDGGHITGFFSVLVEGDDHNEPISDATRSTLDGHIYLDRKIAERNRFPAVNILKSVSRVMPGCNTAEESAIISKAKKLIETYTDMEDLIRIGAYKKGSNKDVDQAIEYYSKIEQFLSQMPKEHLAMKDSYLKLKEILKNV